MGEFVKVRKVGGSLVATIPKEMVNALGLKENEQVLLEVSKPMKSYFGIFKGKGLTPFTREEREEMWAEWGE